MTEWTSTKATTYFVSLNVAGFAKPFLALQRPVVPGRELFSGFAVSPALSPRAMLMHYGRTHLVHGLGTTLEGERIDPLAVSVTSAWPLEPSRSSACRANHGSGGCAAAEQWSSTSRLRR